MTDPRTITARRMEIAAYMTRLRCAYPTARIPDLVAQVNGEEVSGWELIQATWERELVRYPSLVLERVFDRVLRRGNGQQFFPSLPEVIELCNDEDEKLMRELADQRAGRLLPPPRSTRAEALRDFFAACEKALKEPTGEWSDSNVPIVEGVLACLCPVFDISPLVATGRQPGSRGVRFNFVGAVVASWQRMKVSSPAGVIHALKRVPELFGRFPTEGLLRTLITDDLPDERIPPEYRKHQPPAEAPAQETA